MTKQDNIKIIATNRKARHDYQILNTFEAGIVLQGTEVKSLRQGKANLKDSYAIIKNGELFLLNMHISPYSHGTAYNHDPLRTRKLLLHRHEIRRLIGQVQEKGLTLVPLKIYFKNGIAKVELALVRGKKLYDRRQDIAKRDAERELQRESKFKARL
ncbi:SsrA-binding protein [candidate division KSB1 bacterium]|nr:MAG: SsrA-binding protein [candidate division KSB1 bacterium]RKY91607.1 MAG: SsrA-binding protein [candidate division KSB1 bacterium]HDI52378.1 SsrA-binding protein SmpB [Bacteroidota bacterium]